MTPTPPTRRIPPAARVRVVLRAAATILRAVLRAGVTVVVAAALAVGLPLLGIPSRAAAALPRAASPDVPPVRVTITRVLPQVPRPGDTLTLQGSVENTGPTTYDTVTVRLRVSPNRLITRTEVRLVAEGTPQVRDGLPVPGTELPVARNFGPGARASWAVSVPVDELSLGGNGVYVAGVEARAAHRQAAASPGGTADLHRVGLRKTFLPWLPRPHLLAPTRLAWRRPRRPAAAWRSWPRPPGPCR